MFFPDLGPRKVVADFTGGDRSSDGGVRWLRQGDQGLGLSRTLAAGFHDPCDVRFVEHSVPPLLTQRLHMFCGAVPLWAQLRTADQDGAAGTVPALEKIVAAIRQRWRPWRVHWGAGWHAAEKSYDLDQ